MIRVLILDGQAEVRWGLRMRLAIEADMAVVGDTGNAQDALALAKTARPDVIVVDIGTRDAHGANVINLLRAVAPAAAVVVHVLHGDETTRAQAHRAGAAAFLEKGAGAADLVPPIRRLVWCHSARVRCTATHPLVT